MAAGRPELGLRVYPVIFACIFFGLCVAANLTTNLDPAKVPQNFLGRLLVVNVFNSTRLALGDRVFTKVLIGQDGWFFFTGDQSMDEYQASRPYSPEELQTFRANVDWLNGELAKQGTRLLLVIAPDKSAVYPQYMPPEIKRIGTTSRLDQIVAEFRQNGNTPVLDLRPAVMAATRNEQTYFRQDSHWNALGSYLGYAETLSLISQWYPAARPHPLSDFQRTDVAPKARDLPRILGLLEFKEPVRGIQPLFPLGTHVVTVPLAGDGTLRLSRNDDQDLPSAVIYYDSFFGGAVPLLETSFRQSTAILFGDSAQWTVKWISLTHPDVVIIETVERRLSNDGWLPSAP